MSRSSFARLATASGLTLGLAVGGAALAPSALAAPAAPTVTPATVAQGASGVTVTISGAGCLDPDSSLPTFGAAGISYGESGDGGMAESEADGTWSVQIELSDGLPAGSYPIISWCEDYYGDELFAYPAQSFTVSAPGTGAPVTAAPVTKATVTKDAKGVVTVTAAPGQSLTPDTPAKVGERRTLRLTGYTPGEKVKLVLHSTPRTIGTFTADAQGVVVASFIAPAGTPAGDHTLKVTRADGSVVSYPITLSAEKLTAAELAATGASVTVPLIGGIVLVLIGAGATFAARRRPTGAAQA